MKLLIHAHAYPEFLSGIYDALPGLATRSYREQFAVLDRESHIWANSIWAEALRPFGYDVMVTISNNEHLQKSWAREQGIPYRPASWRIDIAEAQIASFRPDLVLFTSHGDLRPEWIAHLRETYATLRLFAVWCGMPFRAVEIFRQFDLILTCIPESKERFASLGCNCQHIHHAFAPRVLEHIDAVRDQDIPLSFVGQLIGAPGFHEERIRQLERIAAAMDIIVFSPTHELSRRGGLPSVSGLRQEFYRVLRAMRAPQRAVSRLRLVLRDAIDRNASPEPGVSERLRARMRPAVFGLAMYQTLQRSQVTLNSHIDVSPASASNRRLFEGTGVGSCLLTDHKANLSSLFEPDREVVTFSSTAECIERAQWLLDHPRERREIARAGQRRTLSDHTFAQRAGELDAILRKALAGRAR